MSEQSGRLAEALNCVAEEVSSAMRIHPRPYNSAHEAYAVILEEVCEFWDEVKRKHHVRQCMAEELIQVAATAIRAIVDLELLEINFTERQHGVPPLDTNSLSCPQTHQPDQLAVVVCGKPVSACGAMRHDPANVLPEAGETANR